MRTTSLNFNQQVEENKPQERETESPRQNVHVLIRLCHTQEKEQDTALGTETSASVSVPQAIHLLTRMQVGWIV